MPIERLGRRRGMHESVRTGNTVYISGQVATDENGEIVGKDDIEAQIEQVYKNLERHCRANGGTLRNIVKTTTYVSDGAYRAAIGQMRVAVCGDDPPYQHRGGRLLPWPRPPRRDRGHRLYRVANGRNSPGRQATVVGKAGTD